MARYRTGFFTIDAAIELKPRIFIFHKPKFILLITIILFCSPQSSSQQVDPFYLRLLRDAEISFSIQNYREAIKELEIARFGLYTNRLLLAKSYFYLSLCHYFLDDPKASKYNMIVALEALGVNNLDSLNLLPLARAEVEKLIGLFELDVSAGSENVPVLPEHSRQDEGKPADKKTPERTGRVTTLPPERKTSPVLRLTSAIRETQLSSSRPVDSAWKKYIFPKEYVFAKKIIMNLTKTEATSVIKGANEIESYFLLGDMSYQDGDYAEAEENFEKIVELSAYFPVEDDVWAETQAYLALCAHFMGNTNKAQKILRESRGLLTDSTIDSLPLDDRDKETLKKIRGPSRKEKQEELEAVLSDIRLFRSELHLEVDIHFSLYISHKSFTLPGENKIVIDITGPVDIEAERLHTVNNFNIQTIRVGMFKTDVVRVVFDIQGKFPAYRIEKTDFGLKVFIQKENLDITPQIPCLFMTMEK